MGFLWGFFVGISWNGEFFFGNNAGEVWSDGFNISLLKNYLKLLSRIKLKTLRCYDLKNKQNVAGVIFMSSGNLFKLKGSLIKRTLNMPLFKTNVSG